MEKTLPPLPYAKDALAPHISEETLEFHYGKHHQKYLSTLLELTEGSEWADRSLEDIIRSTEGGIFNNGAQVFNHSFYWNSMKPAGGGAPDGALADAINGKFGSLSGFRDAFKTAAVTQFGSGWAWLVAKDGSLEVLKTLNADNPIRQGYTPLLTIDVWEHAYYIDYRNARPDYVDAWLDNMVNWSFAAENLAAAR
jgi:superoxide dismutase, Fe-Mn family